MNLTEYLAYTKDQLSNLGRFHLIRIVLGNESCDLDSTVCACIYAYFLHSITSSDERILYLPIMNTSPATFRLRSETRWFLQENVSNLIFIDDIDLNEWYEKQKLEIILVDHHLIHPNKFNEIVIEIFDHHTFRADAIPLKEPSAIQIENVGSCATLVAEKLLNASKSTFQMTEEIAYLLTGPILFDTLNFSSTAGKTTEKDRLIYKALREFRSANIDDQQLYRNLRRSAADITGMSIQDILQKDVKQVSGPHIRLVISSLPSDYTVEKFIGQLKTMKDLDEFLAGYDNADGVIILSLETDDDQAKRQLGFYVKQYENLPPINEYIQREEHGLELRERGIPINQARLKLFEQRNAQASRKQVLPVIEQFAKEFVPQNSS